MEPIFSDEYVQHLRKASEEIERQWNQYVEQFTQAGGNWDKMRELIVYTSRSNPQKLRKTDLYLRAKPPIIRRS